MQDATSNEDASRALVSDSVVLESVNSSVDGEADDKLTFSIHGVSPGSTLKIEKSEW